MSDLVCPVCGQTVPLTPGPPHPLFGPAYSMEPMLTHLNTEHPGWEEEDE